MRLAAMLTRRWRKQKQKNKTQTKRISKWAVWQAPHAAASADGAWALVCAEGRIIEPLRVATIVGASASALEVNPSQVGASLAGG